MNPNKTFSTNIEVRFRDLDAIGHANNAVFFTYFEQGRNAFFYEVFQISDPFDLPFILAHISCDYLKPVKYASKVSLRIWVGEIRNKSFVFIYKLVDRSDESIVYAKGESVQVAFDHRQNKTVVVSENLQIRLSEYQHN